MKFNKLILLLIALMAISFQAYSEVATVIIAKGKVTKLGPNQKNASVVKKGDRLVEDTSLLTSKKSFVRIRFADKSTINLGPESKIVIKKMPKKKANMVNLLTGMIKAEVKKQSKKKSKTKMLVKTRTAVMGVRGTKFQSTFNPINKNTSLVTVEGEVAMVKSEAIKKAVKSESVSKTPVEIIDDVDIVENALEKTDNIVEVKAGRYAGVIEKVDRPTEPVRIAPEQYNALAKSMNSKKKAQEVMKPITEKEVLEEQTKKVSATAPKAGGIVDFNTGLYIAPDKSAKFDKETATFKISKDVGKVDTTTGEYIPPKGIKIDPKKGFVIDQKEIAKVAVKDQKNLNNKILALNKNVEEQIVVNKTQATSTSKPWAWLPKNHIVSAQIRPFSEILSVKNKNSGSEADFYSEKANTVILAWKQVWNDKWTSRIRIGGHDVDYDTSEAKNVYYSGGEESELFSLGAHYQYSPDWIVGVDILNRTQHYILPSGTDAISVEDRELATLDLFVSKRLSPWREFAMRMNGIVHLGLDDSGPSSHSGNDGYNDVKTDYFGFTLEGELLYKWKENMSLNTVAFYHRMSAENEDFEFTRNNLGLGFDFIWDI